MLETLGKEMRKPVDSNNDNKKKDISDCRPNFLLLCSVPHERRDIAFVRYE